MLPVSYSTPATEYAYLTLAENVYPLAFTHCESSLEERTVPVVVGQVKLAAAFRC